MLHYFYPENTIIEKNYEPQYNPVEWFFQSLLDEDEKKNFIGRYAYYNQVKKSSEADVFMLPHFYNDYYRLNKVRLVRKVAKQASELNKKIIIWIKGDYDYRIDIDNAIVIIQGPERINGDALRITGPVEIKDHLKEYGKIHFWISKSEIPKIGFVGQTQSKRLELYFIKNIVWHLKYLLRMTQKVPPPLQPHLILRHKAINTLICKEGIEDHFILRDYFLGLTASSKQRNDYFENIINTQYTLCIRGTGNFSFRFYDALCLGRIPVLVDTHSVLPFNKIIDWKNLIVIVPENELNKLPEYIQRFHNRLDDEKFIQRQKDLRQIWEQYLEREAYYVQLSQLLKIECSTNSNHIT